MRLKSFIIRVMNNIYIGPSNIEKIILNELLEKESFINFKYIEINEYVNSFNTHKDDVKTVKSKLIKLKKSFNIYKDIFDENDDINTSFIEDVISIKDDIVKYKLLYSLNPDSLNIDKELKLILDNIDITYDFNIPSDTSNITVVDINYSLINNCIISKLIDNGAKLYKPIKQTNTPYIYKTRSIREEMEFVIQYIVSNELDLNKCGVVLADKSNINLFKTVLNHYNVPYTTTHRDINPSAYKLVCVLDYFVNPSVENYRNIINSNLCATADEAINKYLINHVDNVNALYSSFNRFQDEDDKSYFKKLEDKANKIHSLYIELLKDIKDLKSINFVLIRVLEILPKDEDTKVLVNKINTLSMDDLTIDNYDNIKNLLLQTKKAQLNLETSLEITDLTCPIINKDYLFVLDVTTSNYPGFKPLNSILKEEDVSNSNYPSLKDRKLNYLKSLDYLECSKVTIYVLPYCSYEGKKEELSYELVVRNLEELKFKLLDYGNEYDEKHRVKKGVISSKHIIDNKLSGSVSKFETFVKCPYSYFARYCLGLKPENEYDLNASTVGIIMHEIMKGLVDSKGKDYPKYTEKEMKSIISTYVEDLKKHYPNKLNIINFFNDRLFDSLMLEKKFLIQAEDDTLFVPKEAEKKIDYDINTKSGVTINLIGTIDRIDEYEGYFRIIDYKTSKHTIKSKEFNEGKQLQLFTYAYVYTKKTNATPLGIFYLMLNHESQRLQYFKYSLKENGFVRITDTEYDKFISNHKLSSLGFVSGDGIFVSKQCITGMNKDFGFDKNHSMDYGEMQATLLNIYSDIIDNILKGDFNPKYDERNCKYCSYSTMCHNKYISIDEDEEEEEEDEA